VLKTASLLGLNTHAAGTMYGDSNESKKNTKKGSTLSIEPL